MSADHHAAPDGVAPEVLERLARAATLIQDALTNPLYKTTQAALELSVARAALDLSDALTAIPESVEPRLPFNARDGVRRLRTAFRRLIERWGWGRVVGPDGRAYIAECEKEDRRRGRDLLEVALALAEGYSRRGQEVPQHWHQFIETAEAEGVTTSLSFDVAEGRSQTCWERWLRGSIVGEAPLACTREDLLGLSWASGPLRRHLDETRPRCSRAVVLSPGAAAPAVVPIKTDATEARERQPEASAQPCPVEQAARMIGDSPRGAELLRYLNCQPGRKASLAEIAIALDGAREATACRRRGTIRQRFNRTRRRWKGKAPLSASTSRMEWSSW